MVSVHCKECRFDKTIIETRRSVDGLETTCYCDPEGILKHGEITEEEKKKLLVSIDQNRDSHCKYYKPKWYVRFARFVKKLKQQK
ncbi:MAG TPA: hypothetical protein HPQ03_06360 [Deltaproteobacteria bacterium]|nr:hypothetical protein [Deltaproteobacteria bacterium]